MIEYTDIPNDTDDLERLELASQEASKIIARSLSPKVMDQLQALASENDIGFGDLLVDGLLYLTLGKLAQLEKLGEARTGIADNEQFIVATFRKGEINSSNPFWRVAAITTICDVLETCGIEKSKVEQVKRVIVSSTIDETIH
ncbi:hypothetical protein ACNO5E_17950 [Vibrio parahaemolyticus]